MMNAAHCYIMVVAILSLCCNSQLLSQGCDKTAALACEYDFLQCRLFTGPADDPETMCKCGEIFFGQCLRRAGCQTNVQVSSAAVPTNYMQQCVSLIMQYDCPSTLMCSINCASEASIDKDNVLIMPFNNYGRYHLRVRMCTFVTHPQKLSRYSVIDQVSCKSLDDFLSCPDLIPPLTFVPVAFVKNTTYMEVDSCEISSTGELSCRTDDPPPTRIYGNKFMFPKTYDVPLTSFSICASDADCLGSFCDVKFHPPFCSPKTMIHIQRSGSFYFTDPFGWRESSITTIPRVSYFTCYMDVILRMVVVVLALAS